MIRKATLEDVGWMAMCHWDAYREKFGEESLKGDFKEYIDFTLHDLSSNNIYVDNDHRGYIVCDSSSTDLLDGINIVLIRRMYVKPAHRGRGIFRRLKEFAKAQHDSCQLMCQLTEEELEKYGGKKIGVIAWIS